MLVNPIRAVYLIKNKLIVLHHKNKYIIARLIQKLK